MSVEYSTKNHKFNSYILKLSAKDIWESETLQQEIKYPQANKLAIKPQ